MYVLKMMRGTRTYHAEWKPTSNFVDSDGTVTEIWHNYITEKRNSP